MISQTSVPKTISCIVAVIPTMQLGQIVPAHVVVEVKMPPPALVKSDTPMRSRETALTVDTERLEEWLLVFLRRPIQMSKRQPFNGYGDAANRLPAKGVPVEQADEPNIEEERAPEPHAVTFSFFACFSTS